MVDICWLRRNKEIYMGSKKYITDTVSTSLLGQTHSNPRLQRDQHNDMYLAYSKSRRCSRYDKLYIRDHYPSYQ